MYQILHFLTYHIRAFSIVRCVSVIVRGPVQMYSLYCAGIVLYIYTYTYIYVYIYIHVYIYIFTYFIPTCRHGRERDVTVTTHNKK